MTSAMGRLGVAAALALVAVMAAPPAAAGPLGYYPTYREVDSLLSDLQQKYPHIVRRFALGTRTLQGRDIHAVKISASPASDNGKPEVLITGVQHAAEPIGGAVIRDDLLHLCENYARDAEVKWLVDNRQIYFVPVMNPDGYEFIAGGGDRMWRKNRRPNADGSIGVDLNRNYPFKWGYDDVNSSPTPGATNYRGPAPASEPETRAMMDFVHQRRFRTWQNHHSANDVLVTPFGYDYRVKLPLRDSLAYDALCRGQQAHYGRFKAWGPSYVVYDKWALNGGTEDWGWSDSAKGRIYTVITELGKAQWETESAAREVSQRMRQADLHMARAAGFYPAVKAVAVSDDCPACNRDGVANPGETVAVKVQIGNLGVVDTTPEVRGFLGGASPHLSFPDSTGAYGDVPFLATVRNDSDPFSLVLAPATPAGLRLPLRLRVTWTFRDAAYEKVLPCTLQAGPAVVRIGDRARVLAPFAAVTASSGGGVRFLPPRVREGAGSSGAARLRIWSPDRQVREIRVRAGATGILWDRCDDRGRLVGRGVYAAVWVSPAGLAATRFVLTE